MAKTTLTILGVIIVIMGIWGLIPAWRIDGVIYDSAWFAVVKIVVGLIVIYISAADKTKA
jgi:phage-related holin